jgi:hypothetical protein
VSEGVRKLLWVALGVALAVLIVKEFPSIRRELKIARM